MSRWFLVSLVLLTGCEGVPFLCGGTDESAFTNFDYEVLLAEGTRDNLPRDRLTAATIARQPDGTLLFSGFVLPLDGGDVQALAARILTSGEQARVEEAFRCIPAEVRPTEPTCIDPAYEHAFRWDDRLVIPALVGCQHAVESFSFEKQAELLALLESLRAETEASLR